MKVLIVAKKEFSDQITSKRFLGFLIIFMLFFGISVYQGVNKYMQDYMEYLSGTSVKPNILEIFMGPASTGMFLIGGGIFGILMSFDLLTREKESGTLKTLLSHPVFRDEIITGKAIGTFLAILVVVMLAVVISIGFLIAFGYVPGPGDILKIFEFGLVTIVYIFAFFSIGLFASATAKNTTTSLLIAIGLFFFFLLVVPFLSVVVPNFLVGKPPSPPVSAIGRPTNVNVVTVTNGKVVVRKYTNEEWAEYNRELHEYMEKKRAISSLLFLLSPSNNYLALINSLSNRNIVYPVRDINQNIVSFIVIPIIFFALSYVKFLREEIS